ncbi:hypothetical protein [Streptosporangium longisporum]|uniref:Aminotransferase class V domain-containing protein n=1 Tax=Streptosporangium longisporum TaxID=46187 RepID=A0ABN3XWQ2_9ACTN
MEQTADPLARRCAAAATRRAAGLRRTLRARTPDDDGLLDPASGDHLGMAGDERLTGDEHLNEHLDGRLDEAAVAVTRTWGTGSTHSRLVTGSTTLHARLEARLSAFTGAAGVPRFSCGHLADLAAVVAVGHGAPVVSGAGGHASIVDARRLSPRAAVTPRGDVAAVECVPRPPSVPNGGSCLRLTARATLSSDDLAVIRGALTAVAEMKVTM